VGSISSCAFDGFGDTGNVGVVIDQGDNVTVSNCLFQNQATGVDVMPDGGPSQFIVVVSNTIGNVTFPTGLFGVNASGVSALDIANNTVQMFDSSNGIPIVTNACNDFAVSGNDTWGGFDGIAADSAGPGTNFVTQNTIHNCGAVGIVVDNLATSAIQISSNAFGECGLLAPGDVIFVLGANASGASTFVQNNFYGGHTNQLNFYVVCNFINPHIPPANVTGNTQAQTALSNLI
jgi:hypothetical protein